jgi:hypothetical protein
MKATVAKGRECARETDVIMERLSFEKHQVFDQLMLSTSAILTSRQLLIRVTDAAVMPLDCELAIVTDSQRIYRSH